MRNSENAEIEIRLSGSYASASYNAQHGYIPVNELDLGVVYVIEWRSGQEVAATPEPTETPQLPAYSQEEAQVIASQALQAAYTGFDASELTVNGGSYLRKGNLEGPLYVFTYIKNGMCTYDCIVHAQTGAVLSKADYSEYWASMPTPTPTKRPATPRPDNEISIEEAQAIANASLNNAYAEFASSGVTCTGERQQVKNGFDAPLFQFDYYVGEAHAYCCIVKAANEAVLYQDNKQDPNLTEINYSTPTPAPVYESTVDIGQDTARQISNTALAGRYPTFSRTVFSNIICRYVETEGGSFEIPHYIFEYYDEAGTYFYEVIVHAYTGNVLYICANLPGEGNG